ncbi:MAG: SDR family NAD(P)-dependent oxidoreductase [Mariprofundaceae bacterium]|nr:SDR family NAD(P)-dependent oxidoreductase [Mariprofundaceae bacterium]
MNFKDKIILITGASSGLGKALCLELAKTGCNIIALARHEAGLVKLQKAIEDLGGRCLAIPFDLSRFDQYQDLFDALKTQIPHLDGIVHAAGDLNRCTPMQYVQAKDFQAMLAIHLTAPNMLTQALLPLLEQAPAAQIIFVSCDMAEQAEPNWHAYGISKAALDHAAQMWQLEHPQKKMCFHVVNPGRMRTELMRRAYPGLDPLTIPLPSEAIAPFLAILEKIGLHES